MKYTYLMFGYLLLFTACTTLKDLQTVETVIPCVGSVGQTKGRVFSKEFQKIGEPRISQPIAVSLQSKAFSKTSYKAYQKYRGHLGKQVSIAYNDSLAVPPRFYELRITDLVGIKNVLNQESNNGLLHYLEDDRSLAMLTGISFVVINRQQQMLEEAQHLSLVQKDGHLVLQVENGMLNMEIDMKSLEVFDFETSGFCWQANKRNQPEIAVLTRNREGCPRGTEKTAAKLDETRQYLKL
ncbi:MAG: hypothetical protein AAGC45_06650 [Bacteroidota bacterium]